MQAWIDPFAAWRRDLAKRVEAGQDVTSELLEGAELVRQAARRAGGADGEWLAGHAEQIGGGADPDGARRSRARPDPGGGDGPARRPRPRARASSGTLEVSVEQERARYGAWYELFPRSCAATPGAHGTFADVEKRLPYVAAMGFDVLYLPPIHPIGRAFRKGPNNTLDAGPDDPGSPWAIGAAEGGHKAFHPALGTQADFDHLLAAARRLGIDIALDIAFQCSPDHPYVREHPEWFRHRPDGTIKYAENPPKKYQDIYPLDFECADWKALWAELLDVVLFWCRPRRAHLPRGQPAHQAVPLLGVAHRRGAPAATPTRVFLSEAFTRPKVMQLPRQGRLLAVVHLLHLAQHQAGDHRILHRADADAGRASTCGPTCSPTRRTSCPSSSGTRAGPPSPCASCWPPRWGPATASTARPSRSARTGRRARARSTSTPRSTSSAAGTGTGPNVFREFIARVNRIRRENPALHHDHRLRFHAVDNERLLFYSKTTPDLSNIILVVVNLDPHHAQSGWVRVPLAELGLDAVGSFQVHDLLTDARFLWHGEANFVQLDPAVCPGHIFRLRRKVKTERDFDYFL